jgi:hypothetical protein
MKWLALLPELINRIPLEKLIPRPDRAKRLEELKEILTDVKPEKSHELTPEIAPESLHEIAEEVRGTEAATGCVPCSINHFNTSAGLLNEVMRFARKDGIGSKEVLDRINKCLGELNAMEREDLDSEKIFALPEGEKEIAVKALNASRATRHALESFTTVKDLEKVTADVQTVSSELWREWSRYRLSKIPETEPEVAHAENSQSQ